MITLRRLARVVGAMWGPVWRLWAYLELLPAWLLRDHDYVISTHPGGRHLDESMNLAVFVHFDGRGQVHDYVIFYLHALRDAGFDILFVSNGRGLGEAALARVVPLCVSVLCRRNVGHDFGAYRDGLRFLGDFSRFRWILLVNDSVYGPLFDLQTTLSRCDNGTDVWGMSDSWSGRYHLQSYFLLVNQAVLTSPQFAGFWENLLLVKSKHLIIRRYEIGFTQAMLKGSFTCKALFPYRTAAEDLARASAAGVLADERLGKNMRQFLEGILRRVERGAPLNPMHEFWDHMIYSMNCPFIKRDLLARNPVHIPHAYIWERLLRDVTAYDTDLIVRHLQAISKNRAP